MNIGLTHHNPATSVDGEEPGLLDSGSAAPSSHVEHILKLISPIFAGGEDAGLLDSGAAAPVIASALQRLKEAKDAEAAKAVWAATGLQLPAFLFSVSPAYSHGQKWRHTLTGSHQPFRCGLRRLEPREALRQRVSLLCSLQLRRDVPGQRHRRPQAAAQLSSHCLPRSIPAHWEILWMPGARCSQPSGASMGLIPALLLPQADREDPKAMEQLVEKYELHFLTA